MDHRKLLVIILSVALFVALVLGIGLLALYPNADTAAESRADAGRRTFDPIEYVRSGDEPLGLVEDEEDPDDDDDGLVIVYGSRPDPESPDDVEVTTEVDERQRVDDPARRTTSQPVDPPPTEETPTEETAPARTQPTEQPDSPARPSDDRVAAARRTDASPPAGNEYWIQVLSSPNRDTVEQARRRLSEESLGSVIFPVDVEGTRYYRLRIGPYDQRAEADKFLGWIRELPGFRESYVSLVYRS